MRPPSHPPPARRCEGFTVSPMRAVRASAPVAAAPVMVSFTFKGQKPSGRKPLKKAAAPAAKADKSNILKLFAPAPSKAKAARGKQAAKGKPAVRAGFEKVPSAQPGTAPLALAGQFFSEENWAVQAFTLLKDLPK